MPPGDNGAVSNAGHRAEELGAFLRARRADVDPRTAGIDAHGQIRRVPGLRREEVAQLAMISTDYYTRLEQGRLDGASAGVLEAIVSALRLEPDQRDYLYRLANKGHSLPRRRPVERVRPRIELMLANLRETPALVLGRCLDILAWNPLAAEVFTDFAAVPRRQRNFVRLLFLHPQVRARYVNWEPIARSTVTIFRAAVTDSTDQSRLTELVDELSIHDHDFRTWWAARDVSYRSFGTKHLTHPYVGEFPLDWQLLRTNDDQQAIVVMTAPPRSRTPEVLRRLASRAATPNAPGPKR